MVETSFGDLTFSGRFDSGNAAKFEKVRLISFYFVSPIQLQLGDEEYAVWTRKDCGGTPYETNHSTWFHFSVTGASSGLKIKLNVMNMNKQTVSI